MKSEDKIIKALDVIASMCATDKPQVTKLIAADMTMSLRNNFQTIQHTLDAQSNHAEELQKELIQEREIRESREDVITMIAENLKVEQEPHQTFFERLIEASQNEKQ